MLERERGGKKEMLITDANLRNMQHLEDVSNNVPNGEISSFFFL